MPQAVKHDAFDAYIFEERWQYDPPPITARDVDEHRSAGQDIFNSLFKKRPEYLPDAPEDVKSYIETLRETEEYKELRGTTVMRPGPAYEAARKLLQDYVATRQQKQPETPEERQRARGRARQEMRGAIAAADQYEEVEKLLGLGGGCSPDGEVIESSNRIKTMRSFLNNDKLKRVMKLAGRMVNVADSTCKTELARGVEKLIGVELGDKLPRVLPGELWTLDEPELFAIKLAEKNFQQYQYAAERTKGLGPIVVCVDRSGSMRGDNFDYARALLFGMGHIASSQRRTMYVIMFNHYVSEAVQVKNPKEFAEWIAGLSVEGGTDFDKPLRKAMNIIKEQEKTADIVFVTDGSCTIDSGVVKAINERRAEDKLKVFSLCVGTDSAELKPISTEVLELEQLLSGNELSDSGRDAAKTVFTGILK